MDQTGTYTSKTMLVSFIPIQIVIKEVWFELQKLHWVWCWNRHVELYALGRKTDFRLQFLPWIEQTGTYTSKTMLVSFIPIQIVIKAVWLDLEKLHCVWCWSRLVETHTSCGSSFLITIPALDGSNWNIYQQDHASIIHTYPNSHKRSLVGSTEASGVWCWSRVVN